jgi:two-component system KDP operon response regulator KdpE
MTASHGAPRLRILLLEDEAVNRSLVRAILSRASDAELRSAQVLEAATIAEAREVLRRDRIDVAVLDIRVPDGNGLDLARELAARPRDSRPGIVVVTASVMGPEREAAIAAGGDVFLAKPYRPAELLDALHRVLVPDS